MKTYLKIASLVQAIQNCQQANNKEWEEKHKKTLEKIARESLPSGSGFDCGTKIVLEECKPNRLVLSFEYHHMSEVGYYDGWTKHKAIVTPSLTNNFDLRITGRDRDGFKEYASDVIWEVLNYEYKDGVS